MFRPHVTATRNHRKPSEELLKVPGVIDTVVWYTGNSQVSSEPDNDSVCFGRGWVEGVRVKYKDDEISYERLLDVFFEVQEPKLGSRQSPPLSFHTRSSNGKQPSVAKRKCYASPWGWCTSRNDVD